MKNKTYNRKKAMVAFFLCSSIDFSSFRQTGLSDEFLMLHTIRSWRKIFMSEKEKSKRQEERLLTEMELSWQRTGRYAQFP